MGIVKLTKEDARTVVNLLDSVGGTRFVANYIDNLIDGLQDLININLDKDQIAIVLSALDRIAGTRRLANYIEFSWVESDRQQEQQTK